MVDETIFSEINKHRWLVLKGYAARNLGNSKFQRMHRVIIGISGRREVDHINGDKLDNRRSNLRACSRKQNSRNKSKSHKNTSGFKGVSWHKRDKRWYAQIEVNGKPKHLGCFIDKVEAARAYDIAANKYFRQFARLNLEKKNV